MSEDMRLCLYKYTLILSLVNGLWKFRNVRSGVMFISAAACLKILRHFGGNGMLDKWGKPSEDQTMDPLTER